MGATERPAGAGLGNTAGVRAVVATVNRRRARSRVITFEDVTKRYPDGTVAVDRLSLQAPTGAITVFVGPSGCGKTTSLRMINRMIDATSGRILLDDQDVRAIEGFDRRIGHLCSRTAPEPPSLDTTQG